MCPLGCFSWFFTNCSRYWRGRWWPRFFIPYLQRRRDSLISNIYSTLLLFLSVIHNGRHRFLRIANWNLTWVVFPILIFAILLVISFLGKVIIMKGATMTCATDATRPYIHVHFRSLPSSRLISCVKNCIVSGVFSWEERKWIMISNQRNNPERLRKKTMLTILRFNRQRIYT